ncbi:unnamed protein product [Arctia plantaginis]|uniref:Uncharacterized protein n=1 Tax=Arctia plantaginis TaxID=874455 RepID=A0A8S1BPC9_ARCPL|nr:unnamed protein product [Arctia plantaginis]
MLISCRTLTFINIFLLYYVITNSLAYYVYKNLPAYHHLPGNLRERNSLSYSEDENSQSESGADLQKYVEINNYSHRHKKKTQLHDGQHRRSRHECSCSKCDTDYEHCRTMCDEMCSQNFVQYPFIPNTPKVIPLPYPVPVMILTQRAPDDTISSSTISTISTISLINSKEPTVKLKLYSTPTTTQQPLPVSTTIKVRKTTKTTEATETSCEYLEMSLEKNPSSREEIVRISPKLPNFKKSAPNLLREAYDTYRLGNSKQTFFRTYRPNLIRKMIFNILLLCHALKFSISYTIYSNTDDSSSSSSSEQNDFEKSFMQLRGSSKNEHNHYHMRKFNSGHCRRARKKCSCDKCGSKNDCCKNFCKETCSSNDLSYDTSLQLAPDVVVMPYPVPVLVLLKNSSATATTTTPTTTTTTTESTTTTKTTTTTETTTETEPPTTPPTTTLESLEEIFEEMNSTIPPMAHRFMKFHVDSLNTEALKRFNIMTKKPYRRSFNHVPKSKMKISLPKYGLVKIPEILSNMVVHKFNEKRRALQKEKQKLWASKRHSQ